MTLQTFSLGGLRETFGRILTIPKTKSANALAGRATKAGRPGGKDEGWEGEEEEVRINE